jgi:hypothetical protein
MSSERSRARSSTDSSDQVVLSPSLTSPETDALKHELVFVVSADVRQPDFGAIRALPIGQSVASRVAELAVGRHQASQPKTHGMVAVDAVNPDSESAFERPQGVPHDVRLRSVRVVSSRISATPPATANRAE